MRTTEDYQLSSEDINSLEKQFSKIDLDGDGTLTKRELQLLFRRAGIPIGDQQIKDWISKADTNNDGVIDFYEFMNAFKNEQSNVGLTA